MTFLKLGTQDGLYSGIYAFCNCSSEGTPSTPAIRLSTTADRLPEEHNIIAPVTLTTEGILYNSEVSEDEGWFSLFQTGLDLPDIATAPSDREVADWEMDDSSREELTELL